MAVPSVISIQQQNSSLMKFYHVLSGTRECEITHKNLLEW